MFRNRTGLLTLIFILFLGDMDQSLAARAPQVPQLSPGKSKDQFKDFKGLRSKILNLIGRSRKRVILVSDFLTDGDISSALYLAKYRKVKVNVLLSKRKANKYLSRVRFLNQQGVKVSNRPKTLPIKDPTLLLVDNRLYRISRDLDVLRPDIPASITQVHPKDLNLFLEALIKAFQNHKGIKTTPLPKVGRPRRHNVSRNYRKYKKSPDGSYNYDRSRPSSRPNNVPTRLPKSTVFQKKQRKKILEQEKAQKLDKKADTQDNLNTTTKDQNHQEEPNGQL